MKGRSQHILCTDGCTNFIKYPSGQKNHVLCNIKEAGLSICTCNTSTPYRCRPMREKEINQIINCTVFSDCDLLESSFAPDMLVFNSLEQFQNDFCGDILPTYLLAGGKINFPSVLRLSGPSHISVLEILSIDPIICNILTPQYITGNYTLGNCDDIDKITIL